MKRPVAAGLFELIIKVVEIDDAGIEKGVSFQ